MRRLDSNSGRMREEPFTAGEGSGFFGGRPIGLPFFLLDACASDVPALSRGVFDFDVVLAPLTTSPLSATQY